MEINFNKKKVLIIGGSGKIGQQITYDFSKSGGNVLVIDTINKFKNKKNINFKKLKINKNLKLELKLKKILNNFGCPDILINCSYPKSAGWNRINFDKIESKEISKNVELHQNSYILISILVANLMKKKRCARKYYKFKFHLWLKSTKFKHLQKYFNERKCPLLKY